MMLFSICIVLASLSYANLEQVSSYNDQIDYRLTRLEVSTSEKILELRETINESLKEIRDIKKLISLSNKCAPSASRNFTPPTIMSNYPKNCAEIRRNGITTNGVYKIKPGQNVVYAFCDMDTEGGGWTVFQNRQTGSQDFFNGWNDYKSGFGNLLGEFWLGLETLWELTKDEVNELFIQLEDFDKVKKFAKYTDFAISSELEGYAIKILGPYIGDAGDSLTGHAGAKFSTKDKDQDSFVQSCAVNYVGAWWYTACHSSNLNGKYLKGVVGEGNRAQGMCWLGFRGHLYSLKASRMLVRPKNFKI